MLRDRARGARLVDGRSRKSRGEGGNPAPGSPSHAGRHSPGVDPAGEEGADRHIGDHVLPDSIQDAFARLFHPIRFTAARNDLKARLPEAFNLRLPVGTNVQRVAWRKGSHLAEDAARAKHVTEAEEVVHPPLV